MKERGILFSAEMVRAILDGRKTMTRRVMNPQPIIGPMQGSPAAHFPTLFAWGKNKDSLRAFESEAQLRQSVALGCPYGQPGDRLWVRESFCLAWYSSGDGNPWSVDVDPLTPRKDTIPKEKAENLIVGYRADDKDPDPQCYWPSIHMPRWASRITLEIVSVKVERVQEISHKDIIAEGIEELAACSVPYCNPGKCNSGRCEGVDRAFQFLWDSINAKRPGCSWNDNPWVWAVEFRRAA